MRPSAAWQHPAEWEPHEATWIGWPHNATDWPGKMRAVAWATVEMIRHIVPGEKVVAWVPNAAAERRARRMLADTGIPGDRVRFLTRRTDRSWTRDMGPIFVRRAGGDRALAVLDLHFNGWARYRNWRRDAACAAAAADLLGLPCLDVTHRSRPVVLEGGAIDVNGRGSVLTTEECLLDQGRQCRNPGFTRGDMEAVLGQWLGAPNVLWLGRGVAGDDTHGHVDDLARFVNPRTIVLAATGDPADINYPALQENRERAQSFRLENGERPEVIPLPLPAPRFHQGIRLPASYANFTITNAAVLVPTFNDPRDREALGILGECFPDRPVTGIHAAELVVGLGGPHCLTHEQPAGAPGQRR